MKSVTISDRIDAKQQVESANQFCATDFKLPHPVFYQGFVAPNTEAGLPGVLRRQVPPRLLIRGVDQHLREIGTDRPFHSYSATFEEHYQMQKVHSRTAAKLPYSQAGLGAVFR